MNFRSLHIGTSGWSYKHWAGIFYPEEVKPAKYLEYFTTRYDCVELNSSFYHLPRESTVKGWVERTPENFRFCAKMSRYITHQLRLAGCEEALKKYFTVMGGMQSKLGPVLIQLPPGLKFDEVKTSDFLNLLTEQYDQYRFAIEVRNKTWISDVCFDLLSAHNIAFVIADSGTRYPYHEAITTDFTYLRFHGYEQLYASDYSDDQLAQYAEKIKVWLENGKEVWVFFNNDFHGYAVKNAEKLMDLMRKL